MGPTLSERLSKIVNRITNDNARNLYDRFGTRLRLVTLTLKRRPRPPRSVDAALLGAELPTCDPGSPAGEPADIAKLRARNVTTTWSWTRWRPVAGLGSPAARVPAWSASDCRLRPLLLLVAEALLRIRRAWWRSPGA